MENCILNEPKRRDYNPGGKYEVKKYHELLKGLCDKLGYRYEDIFSQDRTEYVMNRRHCLTRLMYVELCLTQEHIGAILQRDHSTVRHSIEKVNETLFSRGYQDKAILNTYNEIYENYKAK